MEHDPGRPAGDPQLRPTSRGARPRRELGRLSDALSRLFPGASVIN